MPKLVMVSLGMLVCMNSNARECKYIFEQLILHIVRNFSLHQLLLGRKRWPVLNSCQLLLVTIWFNASDWLPEPDTLSCPSWANLFQLKVLILESTVIFNFHQQRYSTTSYWLAPTLNCLCCLLVHTRRHVCYYVWWYSGKIYTLSKRVVL